MVQTRYEDQDGGKKRRSRQGLKAAALNNLKPGRHGDGGGLYLNVDESGSRTWVFRTVVNGERRTMGLGGLSYVTLAQARLKAAELRIKARNGTDIVEERKAVKAADEQQDSIPTFEAAAIVVHTDLAKTFKSDTHSHNWLQSLKTYVFPVFGSKPVDKIDPADVIAAVRPIWTDKGDTAGRTLRRIKTVFDWCLVKRYRNIMANGVRVPMPNPCDVVRAGLPKRKATTQHHEALEYQKLPEFLVELRKVGAALSVKLAFEFTILAAARTGETLGATWQEIDLETKTWTVPGDRMKMKEPHRVPLSARCIEILGLAKQFNDSKVVFPGRSAGRPLSNMAFLMALRRMGHKNLTAHGFRATFKTWAEETTQFDHLVIEASMAHAVKGIERHYLRTTFFDQRRALMDEWCRFATSGAGEKVASNRRKRTASVHSG